MFWLIALLPIALAVTGGIALSKYVFRLLVAAAVRPPVERLRGDDVRARGRPRRLVTRR